MVNKVSDYMVGKTRLKVHRIREPRSSQTTLKSHIQRGIEREGKREKNKKRTPNHS